MGELRAGDLVFAEKKKEGSSGNARCCDRLA
jgi:hypothetical protein